MPKALAIETSARTGSVALAENGVVVGESQFEHGLARAAELVTKIDALCGGRGWTPADLAEIYVSVGPGSFTGLRIGVTLAKTLAFATGARLVAVPSALALAHNAPEGAAYVRTVLDAKRGQVFTSLLQQEADRWVFVEPPQLDDLQAAIARSPRPLHLIGEGLAVHQAAVQPGSDQGVLVVEPARWMARARSVVRIGADLARQGRYTEPDRLLPLYIRQPEAEEKWHAKQAELARTVPMTETK